MSSQSQATCWIVTAGVVGMENQCLGLAEALGVTPVVKRLKLRAPWKQLAPFLRSGLPFAFSGKGDPIAPPFPDLMIASGRAGAMACLYARRYAIAKKQKGPFSIYIQNPVIDPSRFDLVAVPRHDGLLGENVIATRGSLHRVTSERLAHEAKLFALLFADLPSPRLMVSFGGANAVYQFGPEDMKRIAQQLANAAKSCGGSLLITTARRTGPEAVSILRQTLADVPHYIWDGTGANPYYGMMGLADMILVTADSVNMCSEACSTGKPVYVIPLVGGSEKFRRFHQTLRDDGLTRPFTGKIELWKPFAPLNDVELVAARVREMRAAQAD